MDGRDRGVVGATEQPLVRRYGVGDAAATWTVFHAAVHETASRDYTPEQVEAWAPPWVDESKWHEHRAKATTFVACLSDSVVAFSDFTDSGELDMLYVHPQVNRRGVARLLVETVLREAAAAGHQRLRVQASRTALPAFLSFGFTLHGSQQPEVRGQTLENFDMSVELSTQQARSGRR